MALLQDSPLPAIFRDDIGCGAFAEILNIPSRSDHIASCFFELERLNQELKSKLRDDFLSILNGISSINLTSGPQPPSPSPSPPSRSSPLTHGPPFVAEAHSWLLENIANPYPSPAVKASLAQRHDCSLSSINSWFINARRRMGWTALCRRHFSNCRADALDAAHRALVEEDANRPLPADIIHAFISVKASAEELYSSTMTKSALANDLDTIVKDMPDQKGVLVSEKKGNEREKAKKTRAEQNLYPSPDRSPSSSIPSLGDSLADVSEDILPPTQAGRKRRLSSDGAHTPMSESTTRVMKRPRHDYPVPSMASLANACLPSPATSAEEFSDDQMPRVVPITAKSKPQKRRVSDVGMRSPGCSQDRTTGLLLPAISDPFLHSTLESEHAIDEWFKTNFDTLFTVPPPVDISEPDRSTQWEVELFKYTTLDGPQKTCASPTHDDQTLSSAGLTTLEDILQSFESGEFGASSETTHPFIMDLVADPIPDSLSPLADFSQSIDWTALLSEGPSDASLFFKPYVDTALPEIDLSILQLPQAWISVAS